MHFGGFHQLTEYATKAICIRDLLILLENLGNAAMNLSAGRVFVCFECLFHLRPSNSR
jgi:hypothetical protein